MEDNPRLRVSALRGKGLGVVARCNVSAGELLISEKPLFVIPWWARHKTGLAANETKQMVEDEVEDLSELQQERFFNLCDSKCDSENDKTAMGIWRTNNFCLGRSGPRADNGIFLELSRFNHSCMPNAEFHWNSVLKKQEVRAIKDIRQDEEVTLCYMTGNAMAKSRGDRISYLKLSYGFTCTCPACIVPDPEGDELRQEIRDISDKLTELISSNSSDSERRRQGSEGDDGDGEDSSNSNHSEDDPCEGKDDPCEDLSLALTLAEKQYRLMCNLGFKLVSRIDVLTLIMDLTGETADALTARFYFQAGLRTNRLAYGSASQQAIEWEKKYSSFL